jgi:hypothetical protein
LSAIVDSFQSEERTHFARRSMPATGPADLDTRDHAIGESDSQVIF